MPDWRIHSPRNLDWQCHLADCSEEHAESVMAALLSDPHCPEYLELENLTPEPEPEVQRVIDPSWWTFGPEPASGPEPEPEPRKRLFSWRRK